MTSTLTSSPSSPMLKVDVEGQLPIWVSNLARRVLNLDNGRWSIVLTIDGNRKDWTVSSLGKVESSKE